MQENNNEIINSTNDEEVLEGVETTPEETSQDFNKLEETNKRLFARAKKAEDEIKELKSKLSNYQPNNQPVTNSLSREEAILFAQGLTEEDVNLLNDIAKVKNIPISEAKNSEMFKLHQENTKQKKKEEEASLGASKGSGISKKIDIGSLSEADHKKLWLESTKR